jgi:hypothetical protein
MVQSKMQFSYIRSHTQSHTKRLYRNCRSVTLGRKVSHNFSFAGNATILTLQMETVCFSETLVSTYALTWCHSTEGQHRHLDHRENLKSLLCVIQQEVVRMNIT